MDPTDKPLKTLIVLRFSHGEIKNKKHTDNILTSHQQIYSRFDHQKKKERKEKANRSFPFLIW